MVRFLAFLLMAMVLFARPVQAQDAESADMSNHPIDHIILAVPDLAAGSEEIGTLLSVTPSAGGEHPDLGTANTLVGLGDGIYLEIIGPANNAKPSKFAESLAGLTHPELIGFAMQAQDLEAVRKAALEAGISASQIQAGSRKTPDGRLLAWRTLSITDPAYGFLVPFFIDWGDTPHPSTTSVTGPELITWDVGHPAPEGLQKIYDALGIAIRVTTAARPYLRARITTGDKTYDKTVDLLGTGGA